MRDNKTIIECYFVVSHFTTTKRIKHLGGITKVDASLYEQRGTDYSLLVVRLIALDTRTIRYVLVLNHNDFQLIEVQHLAFEARVMKIIAMIQLYSSHSYKCIEMYSVGFIY